MIVDYCIENEIPFHKNGYIHWWEHGQHRNLMVGMFRWIGDAAKALEHNPIGHRIIYDFFSQCERSLRGHTLPILIYDFEKMLWKEPPSEHEMFLDLCRKRVYKRLKK